MAFHLAGVNCQFARRGPRRRTARHDKRNAHKEVKPGEWPALGGWGWAGWGRRVWESVVILCPECKHFPRCRSFLLWHSRRHVSPRAISCRWRRAWPAAGARAAGGTGPGEGGEGGTGRGAVGGWLLEVADEPAFAVALSACQSRLFSHTKECSGVTHN